MVRGDGTGYSGWPRHCDHAAAVPSSSSSWCLRFSFSTEWWTFQSHADLGTHSAHCAADRGDLTVTVLGMVVDALVVVNDRCPGWVAQQTVEFRSCSACGRRPVPGQGCCARWCNDFGSRNAWFDDGYMLHIIQGGFWRFFAIFYMKGLTRLLSSIFVLRYIFDHGSGMFHAVLLVLMHLALCSYDCPQLMLRLLTSCTWKSVHYFLLDLYFQHFPRLKFCASRFFGALEHSQV